MNKLSRESITALVTLADMDTDQFLKSIIGQWDRISDVVSTLVASAAIDGIEPEHEDKVKDMLRVGIRCAAMRHLMTQVMREPKLRDAFEPSDTDLDMQLATIREAAANLREQEC